MDFLVNKNNLDQSSIAPSPPLMLQDGDVLVKIVKFAFTANNISYAATGNALGYWNFFPSKRDGANTNDNEGRIPVWGIGVVVATRCPGIRQHRRIYGYFPMSHYVILHPVQVTTTDFVDGQHHRRSLPAVYNQYLFCDEDPFYTPRTEDAMIVLRPLFFTSWLLVDFLKHPTASYLEDRPFFGASVMIVSSASSKTSIGLAFLLYQYNQRLERNTKLGGTNQKLKVVGLTSARHYALVQSLQIYDQVILYDNLEQELDAQQPSCFVDMAGNTKLTTCLHTHLRDNMNYSCLVGASHVGQGGKPTSKLPGARPKFFFAPAWTARRVQELGGGNGEDRGQDPKSKRWGLKILLHRVLFDYQLFVNWSLLGATNEKFKEENGGQWLHMKRCSGYKQVADGYAACLRGEIEPDTAIVMSLWDPLPSVSKL